MSKPQNSTQKHTKSHQVTNLMDTFGMSRTQATKVLDAVVNDIEAALHNGKEVQMFGVGTLYVKDVASRQRVNPGTRELFTMPAHKRVAFRQSKAGQKRLNGN
jgi:DNA-binding protein HU-beta